MDRVALAAFLLLIAFSFSACSGDDDDNDASSSTDDDNDPAQSGTDDDDDDDDDDDNDDATPPQCWDDQAIGTKTIFADGFDGSEGIAFSDAGELFVAGSGGLAAVQPDGSWELVADFVDPIGIACAPDGFIWVCEFGESNLPTPNDGAIYKVGPDYVPQLVTEGIGNPNGITLTPAGSFLVSDNYTKTIHEVSADGQLTHWSDAVQSPNGMVYAADRAALYVAGSFVANSPVYRVDLNGGGAPTGVETIAHLDALMVPDGIALDREGMLYVTENVGGKVVRLDPATGDYEVIASGLLTPASIAFGRGDDYDPCSIYVTELMGPRVWRIVVGVAGQPLVGDED